MSLVALPCGILFGVAFGLTGIGSVFAVPLLVYALGLPPHQSVCVAMIAVSFVSAVTIVSSWRRHEIDVRAGTSMAVAGLFGAPAGAWLGRFFSGPLLMKMFGLFAVLIAARMFFARKEPSLPGAAVLARQGLTQIAESLAGFAAGVLAGLLGLGGMLVVPSLVFVARIEIHRAIATSRMIVLAIGLAAISSHLLAGQTIPTSATMLFVLGGIIGTAIGREISGHVSERHLQSVFACAAFAIALFILARAFG